MPAPHSMYRSLLLFYPRSFRRHYGDDLVQQFSDLVADRGVRAAWGRTVIDLIVTVPRYRLETMMNEQHIATTLFLGIALLAVGGVLSLLMDLPYLGLVLLVAALLLAVAQRSTLGRAIRTPDASSRRRRLVIAAALALVCAASLVSYGRAVSADDVSGVSLIVHNAIGVPAMVGAIVFLIAGLLAPRPTCRPRVPVDPARGH